MKDILTPEEIKALKMPLPALKKLTIAQQLIVEQQILQDNTPIEEEKDEPTL